MACRMAESRRQTAARAARRRVPREARATSISIAARDGAETASVRPRAALTACSTRAKQPSIVVARAPAPAPPARPARQTPIAGTASYARRRHDAAPQSLARTAPWAARRPSWIAVVGFARAAPRARPAAAATTATAASAASGSAPNPPAPTVSPTARSPTWIAEGVASTARLAPMARAVSLQPTARARSASPACVSRAPTARETAPRRAPTAAAAPARPARAAKGAR